MAMKQTQTKLFDFSDVGLDFCAGSKNLFPTNFKKMFSLGYNKQTASSVVVSGNQVTLSYGVSHGYVANRVLKVNAPELLSINGGEFVIDSVTEDTVTMTIDGAPLSVAGGVITEIAPLGWELVYESGYIQIFKFKDLDESDLYLRLAYQSASTHRNTIMPCIGRSVDLIAGTITDENAYTNGKSGNGSALAAPKWEFSSHWSGAYNSYTYNQGLGVFGKAEVIGSPYHLIIMSGTENYNTVNTVMNGFVPCKALNYESLNFPLLLTYNTGASGSDLRNEQFGSLFFGQVGNVRVSFSQTSSATGSSFYVPQAYKSFTDLDLFNTTTAEPIAFYEYSTKQFLGYISGGLYIAKYASSNTPSITKSTAPATTYDIDFKNTVKIHSPGNAVLALGVLLCAPIEEIKIGD